MGRKVVDEKEEFKQQARLEKVCRIQGVPYGERNPRYLATLFVLTADEKLWSFAEELGITAPKQTFNMKMGGM